MALILPGAGVADIRGSAGGVTFSRTAAGNIMRRRVKPVNPNSAAQTAVRGYLSDLTAVWRDTLTPAQRLAWETYAAGTNWMNRLGQTIQLSGLSMFLRSASIMKQIGRSTWTTAPTTPGIPGQETLWTPTFNITGNDVDVAYTFPVNVADKDYVFYVSPPVSPAVMFHAGPWRYLGKVEGNVSTPPSSPMTAAYPWTLGAGQKVFIYCRRLDPDSRLSEPFQSSGTPA